MQDIAKIAKLVDALRRRDAERDSRNMQVYDVRTNNFAAVQPGTMPDAWPKSIVANSIDVAARQLSENLGVMPSINCTAGVMTSDRARKISQKRTKIAYSYVEESQVRLRLPQGCDWYLSYGSMPIVIEPDFERKRPLIRFDNPLKSYVQQDLHGRVISYTKVWREPAWQLADKFPQYASRIIGEEAGTMRSGSGDAQLECVKYWDGDNIVLFLPERQNQVLMNLPNPFGKVPVVVAMKPSFDNQTRGQFDDVPYIQLARARIAMLGLQATNQTVRAPLAIPPDVQKIPMGDDAIIRTSRPQDIRRVGVDYPAAAFQQEAQLEQELRVATRTPAAATGDVQASIITGRGVEALNSGYDIQIATGQTVIGQALQHALEMAFEMDEKFWPDDDKEIRGMVNGSPFEEKYRPVRDIAGNHQVQVSHGFASGLNPNQALVFLLQLRGDQQVSRDFVQRQLPMDIDITQMQAQIDIEQVEDALKQGVFGLLSSAGIMVQQGMDPTEILRKAASIIGMREKGTPMHEAILLAFAEPEQSARAAGGAAANAGMDQQQQGGPGGGQTPFGVNPLTGAPQGIAPGQAQAGPGGRPDLMTMLAGLGGNGQPNLRSSIKRAIPA
jgi:hypothetical protein